MGCSGSVAADNTGAQPYPKQQHAQRPTQQAPMHQQQQQQQQQQPMVTEIHVKDIKMTKDLLKRYMDLDKKRDHLEQQNVMKRHEEKSREIRELDAAVAKLQAVYNGTVQKCASRAANRKSKKEKNDFDVLNHNSAADEYLQSGAGEAKYHEDLSKEEREWIEALSEEEVAKKDLESMQQARLKSKADFDELMPVYNEVLAVYKEQDELLASIFSGKYGSDLENKLEAEYDFIVDRAQRIAAAKVRWQNGIILLRHGCNQLAIACQNWVKIPTVPHQDAPVKYKIATVTRNHLVAATQNITAAQRYLGDIEYPYCKPAEIQTLAAAVANIYVDMQSGERHHHVYHNCYILMHRRCMALLTWCQQVIEKTICLDLSDATQVAKQKGLALRQERLNLISHKIKEELNEVVQFDANAGFKDSLVVAEQGGDKALADLFKADAEEKPSTEMEALPDDAGAPIPLADLAPVPKREDLFGDVQQVFQKHEVELEEIERQQAMNKARQEQGLEEKLRARRSKRQRMEALALEKQAAE